RVAHIDRDGRRREGEVGDGNVAGCRVGAPETCNQGSGDDRCRQDDGSESDVDLSCSHVASPPLKYTARSGGGSKKYGGNGQPGLRSWKRAVAISHQTSA